MATTTGSKEVHSSESPHNCTRRILFFGETERNSRPAIWSLVHLILAKSIRRAAGVPSLGYISNRRNCRCVRIFSGHNRQPRSDRSITCAAVGPCLCSMMVRRFTGFRTSFRRSSCSGFGTPVQRGNRLPCDRIIFMSAPRLCSCAAPFMPSVKRSKFTHKFLKCKLVVQISMCRCVSARIRAEKGRYAMKLCHLFAGRAERPLPADAVSGRLAFRRAWRHLREYGRSRFSASTGCWTLLAVQPAC
jgi:hypothetical protein